LGVNNHFANFYLMQRGNRSEKGCIHKNHGSASGLCHFRPELFAASRAHLQ